MARRRRNSVSELDEVIVTVAVIILLAVYFTYQTTGVIIVLVIYVTIAIIALKYYYSKKNRLLRKSLEEIDEMDGFEFEKYMKGMYEFLGYSVKHTPLSGDQGADLILKSKDGENIAVQVKRYKGNVPNKAVQEVVASMKLYKCTKGIVVTNSYFTSSAFQLAKANDIELINRKKLSDMIKTVAVMREEREKKKATPTIQKQPEDSILTASIPEKQKDSTKDWMSETQRKEFETKFSK